MRVDFYILQNESSRDFTVCRLCEKAYRQGGRIYIHADSHQHAKALDDLLWTYRDGSFLPHQLANTVQRQGIEPAILIGWNGPAPTDRQILVNLAAEVPDFYTTFERILDIVNQEQTIKTAGRKRFAFYRDQHCDLHHHTL